MTDLLAKYKQYKSGERLDDVAPPSSSSAVPSAPRGCLPDGMTVLEFDGKGFVNFPMEKFLTWQLGWVMLSNLLIKHDSVFYCGNDAVWNKLEDKGEARSWTYKFVHKFIWNGDFRDGTLTVSVRQSLNSFK